MAKTVDFSDDELELIADWYYSAAGESATGSGDPDRKERLKAILKKLGIEPHDMDQHEFDKKV